MWTLSTRPNRQTRPPRQHETTNSTRDTFATELRRVAGIDAASQALGHADLNTTLSIHGHRNQTDLEVAMEAYARWREQQLEDEIVPPEADL
jgi:integrase